MRVAQCQTHENRRRWPAIHHSPGQLDRRSLVRYLTGRTGCRTTADDLVQDAWLKRNRLRTVEPVDNPQAYLRRMAANPAIDDTRADARRPLDPMEIELLREVPDEAPLPGMDTA